MLSRHFHLKAETIKKCLKEAKIVKNQNCNILGGSVFKQERKLFITKR